MNYVRFQVFFLLCQTLTYTEHRWHKAALTSISLGRLLNVLKSVHNSHFLYF